MKAARLTGNEAGSTDMGNGAGTILFISHDGSRTGAPIFLLRFLEWFRKNHNIPFRLLVGNYGELVPDFQALCHVDYFEPKPVLHYKVLRRLKLNGRYRAEHQRLLREKLSNSNIRLVYCNTIASGRILEFLSFLRCPVICHVHELEDSIRRLGPQNLASIKQHASQYIAVSRAVKRNLSARHDIPEDKIQLINGFIPATQLRPSEAANSSQAVRRELGIPMESKLVCAAGSIDTLKGVDLFLRVAETVKQTKKDDGIHFVWVGGRSEIVDSTRRKIQPSLRGTVHFTGPQSDVTPYYDASDVFLLTSREDSFPLVMLEAASRERPVVCFADSGGAPEFVEKDAGLVIPDFDTTKMAEAIMYLLSVPELRRRIGEAARQKVSGNYTLNLGAPKIAKVIQERLHCSE